MTGGSADPLVVSTRELMAVLERWFYRWRAEHESSAGKHERHHVAWGEHSWVTDYQRENHSKAMKTLGPYEALATRAGVPMRAVYRVMSLETKFTSLDMADKLLQAVERPDAIHTEVTVVPNPGWSVLRWVKHMAEQGGCDDY